MTFDMTIYMSSTPHTDHVTLIPSRPSLIWRVNIQNKQYNFRQTDWCHKKLMKIIPTDCQLHPSSKHWILIYVPISPHELYITWSLAAMLRQPTICIIYMGKSQLEKLALMLKVLSPKEWSWNWGNVSKDLECYWVERNSHTPAWVIDKSFVLQLAEVVIPPLMIWMDAKRIAILKDTWPIL